MVLICLFRNGLYNMTEIAECEPESKSLSSAPK